MRKFTIFEIRKGVRYPLTHFFMRKFMRKIRIFSLSKVIFDENFMLKFRPNFHQNKVVMN